MPTKVHLVKAMVFPVVMYGCESWTIKKTVLYFGLSLIHKTWESNNTKTLSRFQVKRPMFPSTEIQVSMKEQS